MVETVLAQHAPAVKVGGRRLSTTAKPSKPQTADKAEADAKAPADDKATGDAKAESDSSSESEDDDVTKRRKKEKKSKDKDYAQRKAEGNRPTRDAQQNFKSFTGQRIAQPAGKGLGN